MTERFTRVDANTMEYRFTLEDEKTWARPWTAEFPFVKMDPEGPFFEFACHEGNRAVHEHAQRRSTRGEAGRRSGREETLELTQLRQTATRSGSG